MRLDLSEDAERGHQLPRNGQALIRWLAKEEPSVLDNRPKQRKRN